MEINGNTHCLLERKKRKLINDAILLYLCKDKKKINYIIIVFNFLD